MWYAYIAEMPRLVLKACYLFLAGGITHDKSVFIAISVYPFKIACALIIVVFGLTEIEGKSCFMLAEACLCNSCWKSVVLYEP